jgi:MFS family permease
VPPVRKRPEPVGAQAVGRTHSLATVVPAIAGVTVVSLPVFLVGALSVQIEHALGEDTKSLGMTVSAYSFGAAVSAAWLGGMVEKFGALRTMRASAGVCALTMVAMAMFTSSWLLFALFMIPAGFAASAMQPATNLLLARRIPRAKQGLAFGLKQAAVPLAATLGGLSVPAIGLAIGWRWAFVCAAVLAVVVGFALPHPRLTLAAYRAGRNSGPVIGATAPLVVLAVGLGLAVGSASSLTGFLAAAAVSSGTSQGGAGLVVALGGACAAVSRTVVGALADRRDPVHLRWVAVMLGLGASGYLLLALCCADRLTALLPVAALVTFATGWGWNGQFNLAVVRAHEDYPARATGITQTGGRFGGVMIPLLYGAIADRYSFATAWCVLSVVVALAAGLMMLGRLMLEHSSAAGPRRAESR